jgi:hypothetical protein
MKKINVILSAVVVLTFALPAFAGHGVERILSNDATHIQVASVTVDQEVSGETLMTGTEDVYQNTYAPVLNVVITYNSKDSSDDATALDDSSDNPQEVVVGGPTVSVSLPVTLAEVAAIQAGRLDAKSLVVLSSAQKPIQIRDEEFTSSCRFDNENAAPSNPECIQTVAKTEMRTIVQVSRK